MRADLSTASPSHIHSQARFIPRKAPEGKQKVYFSKHPQLGTGRAGGNKTYSKQRSFPGRRISQSSGGMQNSCTNSPGASTLPKRSTPGISSRPGQAAKPCSAPAHPHTFAHHRPGTAQRDKDPPVTPQELPITACGLSEGRGLSVNSIKLVNWKAECTKNCENNFKLQNKIKKKQQREALE